MKHLERFLFGCLLLVGTLSVGVALAVGQTEGDSQQPQKKTARSATAAASPTRGAKVFEQNCARFHNAPEGLPSSVSGTVAMHMRVRANLSDADYRALRQFLNP